MHMNIIIYLCICIYLRLCIYLCFLYKTYIKKKYNLKSYGQTFLCIQDVLVTYSEILNIEDIFLENYFKMLNLKVVLFK